MSCHICEARREANLQMLDRYIKRTKEINAQIWENGGLRCISCGETFFDIDDHIKHTVEVHG